MSTPTTSSDAYSDYERAFNVEMLQTQVYGAFFSVVQYQRNSMSVTNAEIARRCGWTRSMMSKHLGAPSNWTLKTISELATALNVNFKFVLIDRTDNSRRFDANGILFDFGIMNQGGVMGAPQVSYSPEPSGSAIQHTKQNATFFQQGFTHLFEITPLETVSLGPEFQS